MGMGKKKTNKVQLRRKTVSSNLKASPVANRKITGIEIIAIVILVVIFGLIVGLFVLQLFHTDSSKNSSPNQIEQGTTIGSTYFPDGDTAAGGNGKLIDGINVTSMENIQYHSHTHLTLFYNGKQIAIPEGIGILSPRTVQNGFVTNGSGYYWLHTHDATGIIHVESPVPAQYTLGNFFDIWGQPLTKDNVAGFKGTVQIYVDGQPYTDDPQAIPLTSHRQITIEVGEPLVPPPNYVFPPGLE